MALLQKTFSYQNPLINHLCFSKELTNDEKGACKKPGLLFLLHCCLRTLDDSDFRPNVAARMMKICASRKRTNR